MDKEDVVHIHSGILLSHKRNKIMPFAVIWMNLETVVLSELSETQKDKCMESRLHGGILKKRTQMNLFIKGKTSHGCRKQPYGYQGLTLGGIRWELGMDMHALFYIK